MPFCAAPDCVGGAAGLKRLTGPTRSPVTLVLSEPLRPADARLLRVRHDVGGGVAR